MTTQLTQQTGNVQELHSLFKSCLDILRNDAEHLIGDEALNELSHFLILKLAEKHITSEKINIYNLELYKDGVTKYGRQKFLDNLEYVKFSKFVEYAKIPEKEGNLKNVFDEFLWKEVLSKHPKFKDVFESGKKSFIKESSTIKKMLLALSSIDFEKYEYDILGEAYESIFVDAVFGGGSNKKSELGQFFTPPKVKKLLVNLVNPTIKENGEVESVLDPSSGTGGILNTVIKHYKQLHKERNLSYDNLSQQLINKIYGIEIKGKIYNLCLSNMLINTGEVLPNVICADSIRMFHNIKVDTIIANPPFSITISYDELLKYLGSMEILNNYVPIKVGGKNSEALFLQMMIHCLNINGRCATILLDGQKIYGSSSGYDKVREYLLKSCDLHEVILCPSGTFTSTASKTCILFFTKKKDRSDVITIEMKDEKRKLTFCNSHATNTVKFYDYNPTTEEKTFIKEVNITEIIANNYSLNHTDYGAVKNNNPTIADVKWCDLGEVCDVDYGTRIVKANNIEGGYPVYGSGKAMFNTNTFNREGFNILIGRFALSQECVRLISDKIFLNDSGLSIKPKNTNILLHKFIAYYLYLNQPIIYNCARGAAQKNLDMDSFRDIKIPIPSIELQNEIVEFLDKLFITKYNLHQFIDYYKDDNLFTLLLHGEYELFEKLVEWHQHSLEMQKHIEFIKTKQQTYIYLATHNLSVKPLGEVCDIDYGTRIVKANNIESCYPVYGSGKAMFNTNTFNREGFNVLIGRFALSQECVRLIGDKLFLNDSGLSIKPKNTNMLLHKFIAYYLYQNQNIIYDCARGAAQKNLNMDAFRDIKIPIPSLERQKEIVEYCEYNDTLIKQLEREIEKNKKQAQMFLANIIKVVGTKPESNTELQSSTDSQTPTENTTTTDTETQDDAVSVTSSTSEYSQALLINPEHFTPEYLAQKSVSDLKKIKKIHKIRAKVTGETVEEYTRIIREWYTKRTSKPAKKQSTPRRKAQNIAASTATDNTTVLALDLTVPE